MMPGASREPAVRRLARLAVPLLAAAFAAVAVRGLDRFTTTLESRQVAAVLHARADALAGGDRAAFLARADGDPAWRRFQAIVWEQDIERGGGLRVVRVEDFGALRRVRAAVDEGERTYVLRRIRGAWVTTEPTAAELGPWRVREEGLLRVHFHPRWDDPAVIEQLLAIVGDMGVVIGLQFLLDPTPIEIYLHHRVADRQALGWETITRRGESRAREIHLWAPDSYGWGVRRRGAAFGRDLRETLALHLLLVLF